ncbi:SAP30-binding protein, putative [Galdieria sulphuraria]|uniref:SAP30-binding protein, putative n=1 Tax=Galdieria sulphuraria TaxID=130081 RepID=M2XWX8_GALSU|nr:SAP30-binding protein, putative [Galdieria sulphuraria]EME28133.1 SAP30-binding protein, putative [Galdieria sulphuraria]|eukprot:XP_005704653.1 SAP30-binding protein, putative [Galdieria sulphuraria]
MNEHSNSNNNNNNSSSSSAGEDASPGETIGNPTNPKIRVLSVTLETQESKKDEEGSLKSLEPAAGLVEWVEWAFVKLQQGVDFNERMRTNKEFRNPGILEKMVAYCELDELGTNFDRTVFDPKSYDPSEYYDVLAEKQRLLATKEALNPKGSKKEEQGDARSSWKERKVRSTQSRWDRTKSYRN